MLVLTRKQNQTIVLPRLGVTVAVLGVIGNKVKLGITTTDPKEPAHRSEVWARIQNPQPEEPAAASARRI